MLDPLTVVQDCVRAGRVELAEHAYHQLLARLIDPEVAIEGVLQGKLLEDYQRTRDEARILVRQPESDGSQLHAVWDLPLEPDDPAVLVTAYRPGFFD